MRFCLSVPPVSCERPFSFVGVLAACIVAVMTVSVPAEAQSAQVGIRAGPTFGFLNDSAVPFVSAGGDATANTNVRLDLHAGAYVIVPLAAPFGLQAELLYLRKGGHLSRPEERSYRVERYQLSYLQGQVLGRRDISITGPLSLHLLVGVTLKRLLSGLVRREIHTEQFVLRETIDLHGQDLVRKWDLGGLIGVGVGYPIGSTGRLALELRYNPGFRSVFTEAARPPDRKLGRFADPPPLTRFPPSLRHDVITASLAYKLPIDRGTSP